MNVNESDTKKDDPRSITYWLRAANHSISADVATAITGDGDRHERLSAVVDAKIADAVSPEELATTIASLEKISRAFGWDEDAALADGHGPFGRGFGGPFGRGREFGRGFRPGFGPGRGHGPGFGFRPGFGPDSHDGACRAEHGGHEHGEHSMHGDHEYGNRHHDHRRGHKRFAQHAYERGFDAGYSRGRED